MPTVEDAAALALALPGVGERSSYGHRAWFAGKRNFGWVRPFSKADVMRFGDKPVPAGEILAVAVGDLGEKEAVLAANADAFFTIEHFRDYPAVLIRLDVVSRSALAEALEDAWLATAPESLIAQYRAT